MKKIIPFSIFVLCLILCSCDSGATKGKTPSTSTPTTTPTTRPLTPSNTPTAEAPADKGAPAVPADTDSELPQPAKTDGECIYIKFKGLAKINAIEEAPEGADNCPNAALVKFSFGPINASDIKRYKYTIFKDEEQFLTINGGMNPSREWLTRTGIQEGAILQCTRKELFQGDCSLVVFEFTEIDTEPKERCL